MNLLEKLKKLPKDKLDEIRIFVDNLDDVFLSPSGKKLIFFHPHEALEKFEYKSFHRAVKNAGFKDNEWIFIDSNFEGDYKNVLHIDYQMYRTLNHLLESPNINFFPYTDEQIKVLKEFKREKIFLSYNGYPHSHRIMLTYELKKRGLLDDGLVSLLKKPSSQDFVELRKRLNTDDDWGESDDYFSKEHLLDVREDFENGVSFQALNSDMYKDNFVWHSLDFPFEHLKNTYFNIVPETKFFTIEENAKYIFVTEKTYKSLVTQPFIVLGRPKILHFLKQKGFKTFPKMFDESYDDIQDNKERFDFVMNQVQNLCDKGLDIVRKLYLESFENILHNQKLLIKMGEESFETNLKRLIKNE